MAMDPRLRDVWGRIAAHRFDDPTARLTFTARLARENGWTIGRAVRVVDEYRRFAFLARTAGHPVTPSEDVDQAWHLHLAYTHDYWETWCRDVLGAPLHHGPTRGGQAEADRYDSQYRRTLAAYTAAFDEVPPADIWPPAERRFGPDLAWRRVNLACNWVIPKPAWLADWPRRWTAAATLASMPLVAAVPLLGFGIPNPLDLPGTPFLGLFAALVTASMIAGVLLRSIVRPAGEPTLTLDDVGPLELALLADDGRIRFAAAGLAALAPENAEPPADPIVEPLRARIDAIGDAVPADRVRAVVEAAREEFEPRLVERGLLVGAWWKTAAPWIILAPMIATLALGCAKIAVGISRGKPVGFLVLGCFYLAGVSFLLLGRKPRRTKRADTLVREAWRRFRASGQQESWSKAGGIAALAPLAVALFGTGALRGESFTSINEALRAHQARNSGSGSGGCSSPDGGCGGGGCGGCGGCGGGGD